MSDDVTTMQKLLDKSKLEFLEHGFKDASLRNIAAAAGLTTGAIYGYFKDKNAIFEALVAPVCGEIEKLFSSVSESYYNENFIAEINVQKTIEELNRIYRFIYDNYDEFRLLLCCAEGSSKSDYVHTIIEYEVNHTLAYLDKLKEHNNKDFAMDVLTIHILSDSYINSVLEPVRHKMSFEDAVKNAEFIGRFYTGGWETVIKALLKGCG